MLLFTSLGFSANEYCHFELRLLGNPNKGAHTVAETYGLIGNSVNECQEGVKGSAVILSGGVVVYGARLIFTRGAIVHAAIPKKMRPLILSSVYFQEGVLKVKGWMLQGLKKVDLSIDSFCINTFFNVDDSPLH